MISQKDVITHIGFKDIVLGRLFPELSANQKNVAERRENNGEIDERMLVNAEKETRSKNESVKRGIFLHKIEGKEEKEKQRNWENGSSNLCFDRKKNNQQSE